MVSSLAERYSNEIIPAMNKKSNYDSVMETPKVDKVVLNMGVGDAVSNARNLGEAIEKLTLASSQKPLITRAKKSIANLCLRKGMSIGAKITLRGDRMYDFLYKLINVSLPRIHDFRGIDSRSFDGRGNYILGVKEQLIFPEIGYDKVNRVRGLDVVIIAITGTDEEACKLLTESGMPLARQFGGH